MKISLLSSFLLASLLFYFTQCKKNDSSPAATATVNYSPLTVGSNWTYTYSHDTSAATTYTVTVSDKDTAINGKTYKVLNGTNGMGNTYEAKEDSNYYRFSSFAGIGSIEELYLKDNRPVNSPWTNNATFNYPGAPLPLTANLTYNITEKGISHDVNGKTYKDVIHVNVDVSVFSASIGTADFYYANGIGLIDNLIKLTPPGVQFISKQQLVSYQIK